HLRKQQGGGSFSKAATGKTRGPGGLKMIYLGGGAEFCRKRGAMSATPANVHGEVHGEPHGVQVTSGEPILRTAETRGGVMDKHTSDSHRQPVTTARGNIIGADGVVRPPWATRSELERAYFDEEWGRPSITESGLLERICLEGFQSGLSWATILRKRRAFRDHFFLFDAT